ncbi:head decoration protein [Pseudobacteriovorax antillogorgiicola]|uniref:Bacteriophage lambda head decoration protein D n=1 Tax=Pseudobacteriovorax antillogorgiicola TaxID=1513793 RepID=A0A1Y6CVV8_9BACT|nr:head decoration protein [Pseudobacteriovorax antillogorgiicola]TCS51636.1 bacteriophage lambda head decoration protein D [Pseudobacteriovorax antillogorgiicola]SMF81601.1 Bacteriophage lambda head decoration protein D [Pseudobacteriovorax antillogorgiicola]
MTGFNPHYKKIADWTPKQWIGRSFPVQMRQEVIIKAGQKLEAGSILGRDGDNKHVLCAKLAEDDSEIGDGTETPNCILADDIDASVKDQKAIAFLTGSFIKGALLMAKGILLKPLGMSLENSVSF